MHKQFSVRRGVRLSGKQNHGLSSRNCLFKRLIKRAKYGPFIAPKPGHPARVGLSMQYQIYGGSSALAMKH